MRVLDGSKSSIEISIHALLAESDIFDDIFRNLLNDFYPRSPCGERPYTTTITICIVSFLSTLSLRRATKARRDSCQHPAGISIHALLAESDPPRVIREPATSGFLSTLSLRRATSKSRQTLCRISISIHALLAESDHQTNTGGNESGEFLSTLSLRRATTDGSICLDSKLLFLSTLSLRRAT